MAGYKDLMQNGPFKHQPGLPRRFMWHFESAKYSGEELFDIMIGKLNSEDWKLDTVALPKVPVKQGNAWPKVRRVS